MKIRSFFSLSLLAAFCVFACSSLAWGSCTTSSSTGQCGPYSDSNITESNGSNTYVDNDVWGGPTWTQTLTATNASSWNVSANIAASTSRVSYPNTTQDYNGEAVSSFTNIVGTFNETSPHNSSTEEQAGFDMYLNNWGTEMQVLVDMVNSTQCNGTTPVKTSVSFGGSYGVPTASWDLCYTGSMYYWQLVKGSSGTWGTSSSSVELISMIKYLETNGYISSSSTMTEVSYGFIIDTTSSTTETFTVNSYSLINNASGGGSSPTISLSPTSLSFNATAGGSNPSAQTVTVSNSGGGTLASPTTSISYSQGSGWLAVNCTGSSAPYSCSTQPTTGSLTAGTYNATVDVYSSGATNSPQSYTVAFTVSSGSVCSTSSATGTCGPYTDSSITDSSTFPVITENDVWSPPATWSQTLYSTNPGDWYVTANFPTDSSGAIHTYPDLNIQYYDSTEPTLDSYSYMYSSFSETPDTSSTTVSDIGFDIWMNNWGNEVMIQHQVINIVPCTSFATHVVATNVSFGGTHGVPTNTWNLCQFGNEGSGSVELVWQLTDPNDVSNFGFDSGSVDVYAMLKYLESNTACYSSSGPGSDCLQASSTFTSTEYGFEISSTGGLSKNFTVNSFSLTASH